MRNQSSAMKFIERAINNGEMTRPEQCEVCTSVPISYKAHAIVAHHWNGYDDPLNIWWVCRSCNRFLAHKHDGSLSIEQAKKYVHWLQLQKLGYYSEADLQDKPSQIIRESRPAYTVGAIQ
jgi:hypothetical protein